MVANELADEEPGLAFVGETGSFESLSNREELDSKRERQGSGSVTGPESDTNAAEEPQSGLGAS